MAAPLPRSLSCVKRLQKEYVNYQTSSDPDIYLRPVSPVDLTRWNCLIRGPPGSPYAGGLYALSITIPSDYPMTPPIITFQSKIFHPNVHFDTGAICLDILKKEWSPAWTLDNALRAVVALMSSPEDGADSPLNCDAGNLIRSGDLRAFRELAEMYNRECCVGAPGVKWPK